MVDPGSLTGNSHTPRPDAAILELTGACWYLTGPTASGKTAVGLDLANRLDAEIVSLDSMSIYREMDIGTAKPTAQEQAQCPHHLIDQIPPTRCSAWPITLMPPRMYSPDSWP